MKAEHFKIEKYNDNYREQLLSVWEKSVLATHDFLHPTDFQEIKEAVATNNFNDFPVYCMTGDEVVVGFLGVAEKKIEMLFIDPDYLGQGLGKRLMEFAITELGADKVDVNEQNSNALAFYQKLGFETFERTDKDDQGRNYPLLRMKLKQ